MSLRDYHFAMHGRPAPPVDESRLADYLVGSNCTLARSRRPGMEAGVPAALHELRGLAPLGPYVVWDFPRVPMRLVELMLAVSRARCRQEMTETLFYLSWGIRPGLSDEHTRLMSHEEGWSLEFPDQEADSESVVPLHTGAGSATGRAVIEVHSHHEMAAEFSETDDTDELGWFRVYAILGTIFDRPTVRARVAVFGHSWEFPAAEFFELPEGLADAYKRHFDFGDQHAQTR